MANIRPATQADLKAMGIKLQRTAHVHAVETQGRLAALFGYYMHEGSIVVFANIEPWTRRQNGFARNVLKYARALLEETTKFDMVVLAGADSSIDGSDRLLKRLGFKHELGEVYSWRGHRSH